MELELEQTQQDSSHEVSVSTEGVEELKRIDQTMALQPHSSGVKIQDPMLDHQDKYMMKAQDQTMALQPHSSGVKIQDLVLNQQRYIQDESLFYQSLPQISDVQALPHKNMFNKIDDQCNHEWRDERYPLWAHDPWKKESIMKVAKMVMSLHTIRDLERCPVYGRSFKKVTEYQDYLQHTISIAIMLVSHRGASMSKGGSTYNMSAAPVTVFVHLKLSKVGKRFAFVRFLKSANLDSLINDLNTILIGSYHLFAAKARFEKNQNPPINSNPKTTSLNLNPKIHQSKPAPFFPHANSKQSYVNVLNGSEPNKPAPQSKSILKSVTLEEFDLIDSSVAKNAILAKVRDVHLISNINIVLNKEGFYNFQCMYIGGLWIWIEFDSQEACLKMQSNSELSWYFTHLKLIHQSFVLDERAVWIEICGLPLNGWCSKAFKKIASIWGTPLFVDEDPNETVSTGRVCIKTKIHDNINEKCKVVILGKPYGVSVKEFADWNPDIKDADSLSSYKSDKDHSSIQGDDLSGDDFLDKEDGELNDDKLDKEDGEYVEEEEFVNNTQWSEGIEPNKLEKNQDMSSFDHSPKV
nr:RNA-directed DNA polymerase, eukaryota [Tanacetum cinerariifolium]